MQKRRIKINTNQLALPFGKGRELSISYDQREKAFWFLALISLLSLGVYFYAINSTAHSIAMRQHLEREVADLSTELSSLEFAAIELRNSITIELAEQHGFKEVKKPLYVSRDREDSLTLNSER